MRRINPESWPAPRGYNNAVLISPGQILFVAGQVGWDKEAVFAEGLVAQFDQVLENILTIVRSAGGSPENIGRFTIYLKDKKEYLARRTDLGVVYRKHMGTHYPAMSLLIVNDLLEEQALVEVEATAVLP